MTLLNNMRMRAGYSLIECMVVIGLLALVAGLAVANVSFLNRLVARSHVAQLFTACRYMQARSQATNQEVQITFGDDNRSYVCDEHKHVLPSSLSFTAPSGVKGPPSSPRKPLTSGVTFTNRCISFYPSGIIKAGSVYCFDTTTNALYALSSPVADFSYVRMYCYDGAWSLVQ